MFKLVTKQTLYNSVLILTGYITAVPFFLFFFLPYRKLPDDPKAEWSVSLVSSEILKHIRAHSINMVRPTLCLCLSKKWLLCHFLYGVTAQFPRHYMLEIHVLYCFLCTMCSGTAASLLINPVSRWSA